MIFVSTSVVENVSPTLPSSVISSYPVNFSVVVSVTCFLKWTTPLPVVGVTGFTVSSYTKVTTLSSVPIVPVASAESSAKPLLAATNL